MQRPINELFENSIENVKEFMDTSKIIGTPLKIDENTTIIPIAKITLGFGIGGSEFKAKEENKKKNREDVLFELSEEKLPYGGGTLGGVSMIPEAFIVHNKNKVEIIYMEKNKDLFERTIELVNDIVEKSKNK